MAVDHSSAAQRALSVNELFSSSGFADQGQAEGRTVEAQTLLRM